MRKVEIRTNAKLPKVGILLSRPFLALFVFSVAFSSSRVVPANSFAYQVEKNQEEEQEKEHDGTADFEKATELKVSAKTLRDLDEISRLCRSAIEKGLDKETKEFCETMLVDTLMLYSKTASSKVLIRRDRRWQFLRSEALKRLNEVTELRSDNKKAYLLIAQLNLLEGGDRAEVADAVEKLIEISGDDKKTMSDALVFRSAITTDRKERIKDLQEAIDIMPTNFTARRERGTFYLATGETEKAIEDFEFLFEKNPKDSRSALMLSEILYNTKKYKRALGVLEKVKLRAEDPRGNLLRANIFIRMEKHLECIEAADKVLKINSRNPNARLLKIRGQIGAKKLDDALEECNSFVRMFPRAWQGRWYRSAVLADQEKYDEAIEDLQVLVEQTSAPGNGLFMMQLGSLYNASDRPRLAIKHFTEMLDDYPGQKSILRSRGDAYLSIGKHKEAIADYQKQLESTPNDSGTLNNLAWVLSTSPEDELRDGKKGLELAKKACELTEYDKPYILSTLAGCYAEKGDFENALKWIKEAKSKAEKQDSENLKDIKKELEAYKNKKPWREKESTKEKPLASKEKESKKDKKEEEDDF